MSNNQSSILGNASSTLGNVYSSVSDGLSSIKNTASSMTDFSSSGSLGQASGEFLQSNSIIAKLAFLFFVIILFHITLRLGMFAMDYFSKASENPYLIEGLIVGTNAIVIPQDPKNEHAVTILRSNNKSTGIEFSWSVWLYINDLTPVTTSDSYSHIFHKGSRDYNGSVSAITNGPGVYLNHKSDPTIRIIMDTVDPANPGILDINNIPLRKWFNLIIRMQNTSMDVYINGVVTSHIILDKVPKQNYYDVFVCDKGGFAGNLSNLRYYSKALNIFDINGIVKAGPNLKPSTSPAVTQAIGIVPPKYAFSYLANQWYTSRDT